MVEDSTTDDNTQNSFNVRAENSPIRVHTYPEIETPISSINASARSIVDIRNELQNVLDLMGPTTTANTSSEADEESQLTSLNRERETNSVSTKTSRKKSIYTASSFRPKQEDIKIEENLDTNRDSLIADVSTITNNLFEDVEHSCCNHNHTIIHPECLCPNQIPITTNRFYEGCCPNKITTLDYKKPGIMNWIKEKSSEMLLKKTMSNGCELYKINIQQMEDGAPPKRVIFDLVTGISKSYPNPCKKPIEKIRAIQEECERDLDCYEKDTKNNYNKSINKQKPVRQQKNKSYDCDGNTRVDFYYFDHGNAQYFNTTDAPPILKSEILAEKTERYTTRFWAEFFASIHIGVSFGVSFILQFFKFLLYSIVRPLCVGLMQMGSDYCLKPFLTTFFNGVLQPLLIFFYNTATSVRDLCDPIAECFGYFCREIAGIFKAIRLCSYKKNSKDEGCECGKNEKYQS